MKSPIAVFPLFFFALMAGHPVIAVPAAEDGRVLVERPAEPAGKQFDPRTEKGLAWLVSKQNENGSWSECVTDHLYQHRMIERRPASEESPESENPAEMQLVPDVAVTCMATMALTRTGSTASSGAHAAEIRRAIEFVCGEIESSDAESLAITSNRGTRAQMKLGTYIDTFMAATVLAEAKDKMPTLEENERLEEALDKLIAKIEGNQREDGTWANEGWAPTLAQAMASKSINRVALAGADIDEKVREKAETYARNQFDKETGGFAASGSAGVELYAAAASLSSMQESDYANRMREEELAQAASFDPSVATKSAGDIARFESNRGDLRAARQAVVGRLDDEGFVAGFGSNGGEEFLSYLNISESLAVEGGVEWEEWREKITRNLLHVQASDGSWAGHHCITDPTFCTSAALLVLLTDRDAVPIHERMTQR